jgi:beta-galactosidase
VKHTFVISTFFVLASISSLVSGEDISNSGWRLWPDQQAAWKDDTLYLPSDVHLDQMPVNPPTGGWAALDDKQGIPVTLPSTVEEHYWGKFGTRPYGRGEAQRGRNTSFPNGNYLGVSWWWRQIQVPDFKPGQRVTVSFRGARLRAEVYCNGKLCGYTIMTELPFTADLTDAVKPGQPAQLAIRITNPGGHLDWIDFPSSRIIWGKYTLPPSHGFGGLDSDIQLAVRDNASITDLAAINKPDLHQVHLVADVTSVVQKYSGPVHFQISRDGKTVWSGDSTVDVGPGETKTVEFDATVDSAVPWDLKHPNLYKARASLEGLSNSDRSVNFGFRYLTAEGIGTDAKLTLNDKRVVLISAISWGYWGRNGLWPDSEMADREVSDAKKLGLNCLNFHRNIGKPEVLDEQDRKGLLRIEEPGGGKFVIGTRYTRGPFDQDGNFIVSGRNDGGGALDPKRDYVEPDSVDTSGNGPDGDPIAFWEKYEQEKILEMVKRDRSHPSLILYNIQNESSDLNLNNPRVFRIFRLMHALDPSRIITFFSGGDPRIAQVLMLPYSDDISYGSKTIAYAGWKDSHTCGGPCNYLDNLYTDPLHFVQRQKEEDRKEISAWGEMLGSGSVDDYDKLVHSFDAAHPTGYELDDMKKVLAGYHDFLDKWGFRKAFPTDSSLFHAIGYRTYYFWQRIVEQSRADNANDLLVISGWESTTIDNHSGIVDNHRFFKGDPTVLAKACAPEILFMQPRNMIVAKGDTDLVDVFLINEVNRTGPQTLRLTARNADGTVAFTTQKEVYATGGDTYGELLDEAIEIPAKMTGMLNLKATLTPKSKDGPGVLTGTDQIEVIDVAGAPIFKNVAVVEPRSEVSDTLTNIFHVKPVNFADVPASTHLDAIVLAIGSNKNELPSIPSVAADSASTSSTDIVETPEISKEVFAAATKRVHDDGTRLVLWLDANAAAEAVCKELASEGIVKYDGYVGNLDAPWFGSWFFVRKHWLLAGLPTDCAMDWRYGVSAFGGPVWTKNRPPGNRTDGQMLDAPGMEVAVGFGADHNTKVGMSGCVIPYGKGQIVFYCLPQMVLSLNPGNFAISPVVCRRLLGNALRPHAHPMTASAN